MKSFLMIILSFLLCLTSCSKSNGMPTAPEREIPVNQEGKEYISETDAQFFWGRDGNQSGLDTARITKGNDGFYFYDIDHSLLCFYDPEAANGYPLCARPNCNHNSQDCNAYWGDYDIQRIQYVNGNIYLLGCADDELYSVLLMRTQPDGSGRELCYEVFQAEGSISFNALIHRGYLYYTIDITEMSQSSVSVFRRRLDGCGESEKIYTGTDYCGGRAELQAYGNYLYIQESGYASEDGTGYNGRISRISIQTLEHETVVENAYLGFTVDADTLYYDNGTQLIAIQPDSKESKVVYEAGMPVYFAFDGKDLWLDNSCGLFMLGDAAPSGQRTLTLIAPEGTVLAELPLKDEHMMLLFGDGKQVFATIPQIREDMYYNTPMCKADKESVMMGELNWSTLYDS